MRYYVCQLSFENQFLLWAVYVRPYFMYVAPLLETQTQTTQKRFHSACHSKSFKTFMGLPVCLPGAILRQILHDSEATCSEAAERDAVKIRRRFAEGEVFNHPEQQ